MLGYFDHSAVLFYVRMLFGFCGIFRMMTWDYHGATVCLMAAGFCHLFDVRGTSGMERSRSRERFTVLIDSFSELLCFGILPALIVCAGSGLRAASAVGSFYCLCVLIHVICRDGLPVASAALTVPLILSISARYAMKAEIFGLFVLVLMASVYVIPFHLCPLIRRIR